MSRTDYDEVWEKQSDGSMKLVEQTERIVSDKEIENEQRPAILEALIRKPTLTTTDIEEVLRLLVARVFPEKE